MDQETMECLSEIGSSVTIQELQTEVHRLRTDPDCIGRLNQDLIRSSVYYDELTSWSPARERFLFSRYKG